MTILQAFSAQEIGDFPICHLARLSYFPAGVNRGLTGRSLRNGTAPDLFGGLWRRFGESPVRRDPWERRQRPFEIASQAVDVFVRRLDAYMRRRQGIIEFTTDKHCVLRVSARPAYVGEWLPGGRLAVPGEWVGEFHLWNEHIPPMPPGGADMIWGALMRRRLRRSLLLMAEFVQSNPRFANVSVFCGESAFAAGKSLYHTRGMATFFGFEITENRRRDGFWGWWSRLGEAIYLWGMVRTFNPGALKPKSLMRPVWFQFWLTREMLLKKYCAPKVTDAQFVPVSEMTADAGRRAA